MKKYFVFLFVLICLVSLSALTIAETKTEIEFWTINLKADFEDYFNSMISTYEEENPDIKIVWKDLPMDVIQQKLLASISGGVSPDVVNLNTEMALQLAEMGAIVPIDTLDADYENTYFEGVWEAGKYRGNAYTFPWYLSSDILYYNKNILEEAGLDPEEPPRTYDELYNYAKEIKNKTGKTGFIPVTPLYVRLIEEGIPLFNEDNTEPAFNTPEAVKIIEEMRQLVVDGIIPEESLTVGYTGAIERFQSGRLGIMKTGPQFLDRIKENAPDIYENTGVESLTIGKGEVYQVYAMNLVIPQASKNSKEAAEFAHFITGDYAQLEFCKLVNILPSAKGAAEDEFFTDFDDSLKDEAKYVSVKNLEYGKDLTLNIDNSSKLIEIMQDEYEKAFYGETSPQEALDIIEEKWIEIIKQ